MTCRERLDFEQRQKDPAVFVDLRACDVLISAYMPADGDDGFGSSQGIYQAPVK